MEILRRLGNALFGLGIVLGVLWAMFTIAAYGSNDPAIPIIVAMGLVFPAIGWTLRYILNGAVS